MRLELCSACSRIVLRGFSYCPYCGQALRAGPALAEALDGPFRRLDYMQSDFRARKIAQLIAEVDALEIEMDEMVRGLSSAAPLPR